MEGTMAPLTFRVQLKKATVDRKMWPPLLPEQTSFSFYKQMQKRLYNPLDEACLTCHIFTASTVGKSPNLFLVSSAFWDIKLFSLLAADFIDSYHCPHTTWVLCFAFGFRIPRGKGQLIIFLQLKQLFFLMKKCPSWGFVRSWFKSKVSFQSLIHSLHIYNIHIHEKN